DALRSVGRAKLKRAAAVRAVELRCCDLLRLALALRSGGGESEFVECDLATDEDERRLLSVVERAEGPFVAREVCVGVSLAGRDEVRNLAFGGEHASRPFFGDDGRRLRGDGPDGLSELERIERGECIRRGHLNLK